MASTTFLRAPTVSARTLHPAQRAATIRLGSEIQNGSRIADFLVSIGILLLGTLYSAWGGRDCMDYQTVVDIALCVVALYFDCIVSLVPSGAP